MSTIFSWNHRIPKHPKPPPILLKTTFTWSSRKSFRPFSPLRKPRGSPRPFPTLLPGHWQSQTLESPAFVPRGNLKLFLRWLEKINKKPLHKTNSSPLKMLVSNRNLLFPVYFQGRELVVSGMVFPKCLENSRWKVHFHQLETSKKSNPVG